MWKSDEDLIVLEVPEEGSKNATDSPICTWNQLIRELEESGVPEFTVNCHEVVCQSITEAEGGA